MAGKANQLSFGVGWLFAAPLGTAGPTDCTTDLVAPWQCLGYTDGGFTFSYEYSFEGIEVDQEVGEMDHAVTSASGSLSGSMAQINLESLKAAHNGGVIGQAKPVPADGSKWFEPPAPEDIAGVSLVWWAAKKDERLWVAKATQVGNIETKRAKGAEKALIPFQFKVGKVDGQKPFRHIVLPTRETW